MITCFFKWLIFDQILKMEKMGTFSGHFRDKRFFEPDAEKARIFDSEGFVFLRCFTLWKIILFCSESDFQLKFMVFEIFLAQNETKIILNTFQYIRRVFYSQIKEFANPTKLSLDMLFMAFHITSRIIWTPFLIKKSLRYMRCIHYFTQYPLQTRMIRVF